VSLLERLAESGHLLRPLLATPDGNPPPQIPNVWQLLEGLLNDALERFRQTPPEVRNQLFSNLGNVIVQLGTTILSHAADCSQHAKYILWIGILSNGFVLVLEHYALQEVWKVVKEADNMKGETSEMRTKLDDNFKKVGKMVNDFDDFVASLGDKLDEAEYQVLTGLKDKIVQELGAIKAKLVKAEWQIHSVRRGLELVKWRTWQSSMTSGVSGVGALATTALLYTSNPPLAIINSILGVGHFVMAFRNHGAKQMTATKLKELSEELDEILMLERDRQVCEAVVLEVYNKMLKEKGSDKYKELATKYGL